MPYTPPGYDPGTSGGVVLPPAPVSGGLWYDPGYWDAGWYDPRWWPGVVGGAVAAPQIGRDQVALQAIADLLKATGEFGDQVAFGTTADSARVRFDNAPWANVRRLDYSQRKDANPTLSVRTVNYEITATVRLPERDDAEVELDRLDSVVLDALEGQGFGFCLPARSIIGHGQFDVSRYPTARCEWRGTFVYVTNSAVGRDKRELAWNP